MKLFKLDCVICNLKSSNSFEADHTEPLRGRGDGGKKNLRWEDVYNSMLLLSRAKTFAFRREPSRLLVMFVNFTRSLTKIFEFSRLFCIRVLSLNLLRSRERLLRGACSCICTASFEWSEWLPCCQWEIKPETLFVWEEYVSTGGHDGHEGFTREFQIKIKM